MNKKIAIAVALIILLTTYSSREKITISNFNLKKIIIENNYLLKKRLKRNVITNLRKKYSIFK